MVKSRRRRNWRVLALQGPARPWWLSPALLVLGVLLVAIGNEGRPTLHRRGVNNAGLAVAGIACVWMACRLAEFAFYRSIARGARPSNCPMCNYPLHALPGNTCPECGTNVSALRRRAERITGERPNDPGHANR